MRFIELLRTWDREAAEKLADEVFEVRLPLHEAARLAALEDLFPLRTREQLIGELLGAALDEVVETFPYVQGDRIISRDEQGDPIYEDVGHTPRYLELVHQHIQRLQQQRD